MGLPSSTREAASDPFVTCMSPDLDVEGLYH